MRRVVITGVGALTPLGNSFRQSWDALLEGGSGIAPITRFDTGGLPWKAAGELKGFCPDAYMPKKAALRADPFAHYAVAASVMAVEDAGAGAVSEASALVFGSSRGGVLGLEKAVGARKSAYLMPATTVGMAASLVSSALGVRGHVLGVSNACSSGASAIGEAFRIVRHGLADSAIAGGAEAPICRLCLEGYGAMGALSKTGVSRPFDRKRDGFVLAEGAAALVLEEKERAQRRGARIYAEVVGYAGASDADIRTASSGHGQRRAMASALAEAGITAENVDYVSAHAASTRAGDRAEALSIIEAFGPRRPLVCAVKSMTGHMLGASGALEAGFASMGIREGVSPPTVNLDEPEHEIGCLKEPARAELKYAMVNAFGFGGLNAVLVLCGDV